MEQLLGEREYESYHQKNTDNQECFSGDGQLSEIVSESNSSHAFELSADGCSVCLSPGLCRSVIHGLALDSRQDEIAKVGGLQPQGELFGFALLQVEVGQHAVIPDILIGIVAGRGCCGSGVHLFIV